MPVVGLDPAPRLRLADGCTPDYDAVVVAAGAWTPALLAASGLATGGLRTKQIQYTVYQGQLARLGVFVDDITGLYGRRDGDRLFQLGLPCDRWDVDPTDLRPDAGLIEQVVARARCRLGRPMAGDHPVRTVVSSDCYHDPPGLVLREAGSGAPVFTFTGGSGGAAKTVLAASREAAAALLGRRPELSRRDCTGPAPPAVRLAEPGR
jgi:glycine/D-amino acid oxidase-like deaminating enzyme